MAKSRKGRGGPIPFASGSSRFGVPGRTARAFDLIPRAQPAADLETFLAQASSNGALWSPPAEPTPAQTPLSTGREAQRCASNGVRLFGEGRSAEAIALLQRSVQLNPGAAGSHHDLGLALWTTGRAQQAVQAFTDALRLDPNIAKQKFVSWPTGAPYARD